MTIRHNLAHFLSALLTLALVACGSSSTETSDSGARDSGVVDAALLDAALGDAAIGDAAIGDASMSDAAIGDASMSDASIGDASGGDAGTSLCTGLGAAECFGSAACSPVFDDLCCSDCTPGVCADCSNFTYIDCRPIAGCADYCGASPAWACSPSAPSCADARPVDADSCTRTGCVPAVAPVGATPILDTCVPITGSSCTVACRRSPPPCPTGTVPEGDGLCFTDRCIPAFVCARRVEP